MDPFLQSLVARLNQPGVIGIGLTGSYARGENKQHSDVDLDIFVEELPPDKYALRYLEGKLVSLKYVLLADEFASLQKPEKAIWAVPGLRQMRILLDKKGQLANLKQAALGFDWNDLQSAANEHAVENLMGCAEEAHKLMSGLEQGHESKVLYASWGMFKGLSFAVLVQAGLMIESENLVFDLIQNHIGRDHPWTRAFRLSFGMDLGDVNVPAYQTRGKAALELYRETALLFKGIITDKHREVIENTLELIAEGLAPEG
ncbi:MAG: nucleotidyltransferase domain-containing protein [Chloroflexota bacterium]